MADKLIIYQYDSVDYMGNFQVIGNRVRRFDFADGYATYRQNVPAEVLDFHFFVRDHQGSVTAVIGRESAEQLPRYYPFGGLMTQDCMGERVSADKYTGKRLDRMHGLDWYDFGARQYDPVYGRFAGIDPLCEKYPHLSPYAYCGNDPVNAIDVDGDSIIYRIPNWQSRTFDNYYWDVSSSCFLDSNGNPFSGSDDMLSSIQDALIKLQKEEHGMKLVKSLSLSNEKVLIEKSARDNHEVEGDEIYASVVRWNPYKDSAFGGGSFISLAHELAHSLDRILGTINLKRWYSVYNDEGIKTNILKAEIYVTHYENLIRAEQGLSLRTHYSQDENGTPAGGAIFKNGNQSIYFDMLGNHKQKFGRITKNNYIYKIKQQ